MKIFLVSNLYPSNKKPFHGIFVKNFKTQMEQRGATVSPCSTKHDYTGALGQLFSYLHFVLNTWLNILKPYDVIYVHFGCHSLIPLIPLYFFIKKPIIINVHGSDIFPQSKTGKLINLFTKPIFHKAALIVAPSHFFAKAVSTKLSLPLDKIFVSPSSGIDESIFPFAPKNLPENQPLRFGYVSRIIPLKGWKTALFAYQQFDKQQDAASTLDFYGHGEDSPYLTELSSAYSNINIHPGQAQKELASIYSNFDFLIFPTEFKTESLGLVALEALSCGTPVIASNIAAIDEIIDNENNGFLFAAGQPEALVQALTKASLLTAEQYNNISKNAVKTAQKYRASIVGDQLFEKISYIAKQHNKKT